MKKATAVAPSNIAFIKYWGRKDESLRLPANGSISMNLSNFLTTTTVEFSNVYKNDEVIFNGQKEALVENRAIKHIDRIRKLAGIKTKVKVVTENNFPTGTGLSSSASGFAALTVAGVAAAGLQLSEKELSILARQGSGSACRSIPDGFVEWLDGDISETAYARSLYAPDYWELVDVVALTSTQKKEVSSSTGHTTVGSSPFFAVRQKYIKAKIELCKKYLKLRDFKNLGELIEAEALELHAIYLTSNPSLIYLLPETLRVIRAVKKWREDGLAVYFTLNTGQDIHLLCEKKNSNKVVALAQKISGVQKTILNESSVGTRLIERHLF
ncbi:MAG TPA: diphosphomevalonate decarboxylase [Patescibacteria group bacterium]